jgi:hypothetical protein
VKLLSSIGACSENIIAEESRVALTPEPMRL